MRSRELDVMVLMGPFQPEIFYDSMTAVLKPVDYTPKSDFVKECAEPSAAVPLYCCRRYLNY